MANIQELRFWVPLFWRIEMNPWFGVSGSVVTAVVLFFTGSANLASTVGAQAQASATPASTSAAPFVVAPSFPLAGVPTSVATGDLNGDGKLDLVTTDWTSGKVTVSLGLGDGKFAAGIDYTAGANPGSVLIADIDGDGRLDVIVANESAGTISVLPGNGNGTLGQPRTFQAGFNPVTIAAGDFNADGKTDIVASGGSSSLLSVLLNDGQGGLKAPLVRAMAKTATALAVADFNQDEHADVAVANADGTISILLGDGDGSFHSTPDVSIAQTALSSIAAADFNKDGHIDLAVTLSTLKQISVALGKGDGTFASATSYRVGTNPISIALGDVDEDGITDLIVANQGSNTFSVLGGNADGSFRAAIDYVAGKGPLSAVTGDFSGDGHLDVAVLNHDAQTVSVPLGNGDGTFKAARAYTVELQPRAVASGDLTGSKRSDLVVTNYCGSDAACSKGTASVLLAGDNGAYSLGSTYTLGSGPVAVALLDVNGDKKLDIVALNRADKTISILLGLGGDSFQQQFTLPLAESPIAFAVGDFNNDGKTDLAVLGDCGTAQCSQPGTLEILDGTGDGSFRSVQTYPVGYAPNSIAVGDLNNDKNLDLVVSNACGKTASCTASSTTAGTASIFLGSAAGKFTASADIALSNSPSAIALSDLAGRKVLDMLVTQSSSNTLAVLRGQGDGTFQAPVSYQVGSAPGSIAVADFNGDGKPDVAVSNAADATVSVLFGKGDGTLVAGATPSVGPGPESLTAIQSTGGTHASLVTANANSTSATVGSDITMLANIHPEDALTIAPTITLTAPATAPASTSTTLTTVVSGTGGTPTGTVTFAVTPNAIADCNGTASNVVTLAMTDASSATATCVTQTLLAPSESVVANYSGDTTYTGGASSTANIAVGSPTTLALISSGTTSTAGQSVTFTATLGPSPFTPAPSGTITFTVLNGSGAPVAGACPSTTVSATVLAASCTTSTLPVGSYTVSASYTGDTTYATASSTPASAALTVSKATPTLTLTPPTNPSNVGQSISFSANLGPTPFAIAPSGAITFTVTNTGTNTAVAGACSSTTVNAGTLTASCSTSTLAAGIYSISASYSGDTNYAGADSTTATQTVNKLSDTLTLSSSGTTSTVNQSVTFTAALGPTPFTPAPSGTISFTVKNTGTNATVPGICSSTTVTSTTLTASCATSALPVGSYSISASYTGDSTYAAAPTSTPASVALTVGQQTPTLTLTPPTSPSNVNQTISFSANLGPAPFTVAPSGTISFTVKNNATNANVAGVCASTTVNATTLTASCSTNALNAGSYSISASYSGDTNYATAATTTATQTVNQLPATLHLTSSVASPTVGQSVTFTASVTATAITPIVPSGNVVFTINGVAATCTVAPLNASGQTTCTTTSLIAPADNVTATYAGDANFSVTATTGTATLPLTVSKAAAMTSIVSNNAAPTVNQNVTFTATVAPPTGSGTSVLLTGNVIFTQGATQLCPPVTITTTAPQTASCTAAFSAATTGAIITATYSGDTDFGSGMPAPLTQVIKPANTQVMLTSSNASPSVNESVTLTAALAAVPTGAAIPSAGKVVFTDTTTGTTLCTDSFTTPGAALTCSAMFSTAVTHSITAAYTSTDPNFNSSTSGPFSEMVGAGGTVVMITTSLPLPAGSAVNQSVTFSSTVSSPSAGATIPQGSVAYNDTLTGATLCTRTLTNTGTVPDCTVALLTAATHSITAAFTSSNSNFANGTSTVLFQLVNATSTTMMLTPTPTASTVDQSVKFTATITPHFTGAANPTGTVTFSNGKTILCTGTLSSTAATPAVTTASCNSPLVNAGNNLVNAAYLSGDANFTASSNSLTEAVSQTSTIVSAPVTNPSASSVNQPVSFSAVVTPSVTDTGLTLPTGTVIFTDSVAGPLCTSTLAENGSVPPCSAALGTKATHSITALYSGDGNFSKSPVSSPASLVVSAAATQVGVVSSSPTSDVNETVIFTATITTTPSGSVVPMSGTVTFTDTTAPTPPCTNPISTGGIVPACTMAFTTPGTHTIHVTFNSTDPNFQSSATTPFSQTVRGIGTSIVVATTPNPSSVNEPVTFSAVVTSSTAGSAVPQGTVTYKDGTTTLCPQVTLTATGAVPPCTVPLLTSGTHSITAVYVSTTPSFTGGTSTSVNQNVNPPSTTVALTSAPGPSIVDQPVTFTATITPAFAGNTNPTGRVAFTYTLGTNTLTLCSVPQSVVTTGTTVVVSAATCTAPIPDSGAYAVTATYTSGDSNFTAGPPATITQTVTPGNTTVVLGSTSVSPSPSLVNQSVTFTATVQPALSDAGLVPPTGTVTFYDAVAGALCTSSMTNGKVNGCSAALQTSGAHSITAIYSGDNNFTVSPASNILTQTVNQTGTKVIVTSSAPGNINAATTPVTFTAVVSSNFVGVAPTGTLAFVLQENGTTQTCPAIPATAPSGALAASCTIVFPASVTGPVTVSASYSGDANFMPSSGATTETIENFGLGVGLPPGQSGQVYLTQGYSTANDPFHSASDAVSATLSSQSGFAGNIIVQCQVTTPSGDPAGNTVACSPASTTVPAPSSGSLSIPYTYTASNTAPTGVYTVTVTATSQTNPALTQTSITTVSVTGLSGPISLSPGAQETENAYFSTTPVNSNTPPTSLGSFQCLSIFNVATGALTTASASGIACAFPKTSVTIASGATTSVPITVTVGATAAAAVAQRSGSIATAAFWAVPLFALLAWIGQRKSPRRNFFRFLGMLLLVIAIGHTIGCGGSFNRPTLPSSPIPAGNYLIQVSGTGSDNNTYYAVVPVSVN